MLASATRAPHHRARPATYRAYRVLASHVRRTYSPATHRAPWPPRWPLPSDLPYISALSPRWPLPSDLGLVYVDDTAWDASTTEQMAARLGRELPEGALVIDYTAALG